MLFVGFQWHTAFGLTRFSSNGATTTDLRTFSFSVTINGIINNFACTVMHVVFLNIKFFFQMSLAIQRCLLHNICYGTMRNVCSFLCTSHNKVQDHNLLYSCASWKWVVIEGCFKNAHNLCHWSFMLYLLMTSSLLEKPWRKTQATFHFFSVPKAGIVTNWSYFIGCIHDVLCELYSINVVWQDN